MSDKLTIKVGETYRLKSSILKPMKITVLMISTDGMLVVRANGNMGSLKNVYFLPKKAWKNLRNI